MVEVSKLLKSQLRAYDLVARYGGEEFCLVLPETTLKCAKNVAERIRGAIEALSFEATMGDKKVTMSFGIAAYEDGQGEIDALIRLADSALYLAKNSGRNQVQSTVIDD